MSIWERMTAAGIDTDKVERESPAAPDSFVYDLGADGWIAFRPSTTETGEQAGGWDISLQDADGGENVHDWQRDEASAFAAVAKMAGARA